MNTLVLPFKKTTTEQGIWSEAVRRKWHIVRTNELEGSENPFGKGDTVRYYGNVMDAEIVANKLPIKFSSIPVSFLSNVPTALTGRSIKLLQYKDLVQPLERDMFVKCVGNKWFPAQVYRKGESIVSSSLPDDHIYVQDLVDFINEIRCFVLNGKIMTASWYRIEKEFNPTNVTSTQLLTRLGREIENLQRWYADSGLPSGVVLDYGLAGDGNWYLIEANEAWASGLYDCDPSLAFDVIVASQESS
jgi:hypothetical protein